MVTILGHVDHGKTSLTDFISKTNVVSKEHGGITQHIGAYQIEHQGKKITFIDTPGHAAFEKMRSRGADVADVAILVVAVNDGVMVQTVEAINHIKRVGASMIVAVNKVDLIAALPSPDGKGKISFSNPKLKIALERIKKQLSDKEVLVEEYGGDVPLIPLSAKTGEGVDKLLEMILLVADIHEFKGDPEANPEGVVIESSMDKFRGVVATLLVKNGSLKKGQDIVVGGIRGKIKGMFDYQGKSIDLAGPSMPVEVLGLDSVPVVGSVIGGQTTKEELKFHTVSLVDRLKQGENKILKIVVKADKQGSLEAIEHSLEKINKKEKLVEVLSSAVGEILESDVKLASTTRAIVVGFNVKLPSDIQKMAESEKVLVRTYNVIYELLEELEEVVEGMLKQDQLEETLGKAEILVEFPFGKNERVAGCRVLEGGFSRNNKVRVYREDQLIGESKIFSLRKVKEEVNHVDKGTDCGMIFGPPVDFSVGDKVESFRVI